MKALPGVFMALLVLGSLVYSVWAQMTEPALEPALTFMRWQAAWSGGTYGVKLTFAVTWSVLLFGGVVPIAAGSQVVAALASARRQPQLPAWPGLAWERMREPSRARLGLALTTLGLLFGGMCWADPEVFAPVSFLAQIMLVLWPFTLLVGPLLLLDVLLPANVAVGAVTGLERVPGSTPEQAATHHLRIGDSRIELPAALWQQLAVGDQVAVRGSAMFARVLELRRQAPGEP